MPNRFKTIKVTKIDFKGTLLYLMQASRNFWARTYKTLTFVLLLSVYFISHAMTQFLLSKYIPIFIKIRVQKSFTNFYLKSLELFDRRKPGTISRITLIELSIRNMMVKRTRTIITVGGMTIGIGAIVFLVSLGYGLQQLVITRVARLEEMRQADVTPQPGSKVKITDETLTTFDDNPKISMSLPMIAVVGRINYQNSVSDMAVYGVTTDYLKQSAVKPVQGQIFESNQLVAVIPSDESVLGYSAEDLIPEFNKEIRNVDFIIGPTEWIRVRETPSSDSKILGYTKHVEGVSQGKEVWGDSYGKGMISEGPDGNSYSRWIKAPLRLWEEKKCDPKTDGDCENGKYVIMRDNEGYQVQKEGFFGQASAEVSMVGEVLAETTQALELPNDWIFLPEESSASITAETKQVTLAPNSLKQTVVNKAVLNVLNINERDAIGKTFQATFVVVGDLLANQDEKVESYPAEYTIVGVVPDDKTPMIYVPFMDLRSLGITNYSQVKVVVTDQEDLVKVRHQIEALGYLTTSVSDTVAQINALFATVRTILGLLGMVALAVAALGMFNTLTVSLLERTREVGLMKAMGMRSAEVQELFLTESMIMGFFGGVMGIALGFLAGELLGVLLSAFAIFKSVGYIDVAYIPFTFIVVVILLSLIVGFVTGIYPAKRATKISALNALRYE